MIQTYAASHRYGSKSGEGAALLAVPGKSSAGFQGRGEKQGGRSVFCAELLVGLKATARWLFEDVAVQK